VRQEYLTIRQDAKTVDARANIGEIMRICWNLPFLKCGFAEKRLK
jgi:hypothetical protein